MSRCENYYYLELSPDHSHYSGYDRTLQIYGEAQTCLHKVVFDANNTEPAYSSLPVPNRQEFDQSYEYEQEAQRGSYEEDGSRATRSNGKRRSVGSRDSVTSPISHAVYPSEQQHLALPPGAAYHSNLDENRSRSQEPSTSSFKPLATPTHVDLDNEFSEAVNAGWREQQETHQQYDTQQYQQENQEDQYQQPQQHDPYQHANQPSYQTPIAAAFARPQESSHHYEEAPRTNVDQGQADQGAYSEQQQYHQQQEQDDTYDEPEYVDEPIQATPTQDLHHSNAIDRIDEETSSALHSAEKSSGVGIGGFRQPSPPSGSHIQRHQLHDAPVRRDSAEIVAERQMPIAEHQETTHLQNDTDRQTGPAMHLAHASSPSSHSFEPSGDDLEGTGLYGTGSAHRQQEQYDQQVQMDQVDHENGTNEHNQYATADTPVVQEPPTVFVNSESNPEPKPLPASPALGNSPLPSPDSGSRVQPPAIHAQDEQRHPRSASSSSQTSPATNIAAASAIAAAAAASIKPYQSTHTSSKPASKGGQPAHLNMGTSGQHSYTTVATSNKSPISPIITTPTSPNRRERTPPAKQHSYSSGGRTRQDSNEGYGRSSIAYLNDTPTIEPPMKAPPPINLGMPLPSSSPYFNPYAGLRSSSGGTQGEGTPSMGAGSTSSAKPKGARGSAVDTTLGSKHGFDLSATQPAHERPLLQRPPTNLTSGAVREKDYSYAIKSGEDGGGRRLAAGAFRRANPSSSSIPSFRSNDDGGMSPAQRLRDEWRTSQTFAAPPPSEYLTPAQTPSAMPTTAEEYTEAGVEDMYGERAQSRTPLSHRTSAIDAPTDVMPNEELSHNDLHGLAEGGGPEQDDPVLPLNVRKRSIVDGVSIKSNEKSPRPTDGFGGGQFVTRLE